MREFRPKPFKLKSSGTKSAVKASRLSDALTDEQRKAMEAEFERRVMGFKKKWLRCSNKRCRRRQQCLGPPFACHGKAWPRPWTSRQYRRLKRDIYRDPPRVLGARPAP